MRRSASSLALVAAMLCAAPAFAQDAAEDRYDRVVREMQAAKAKQVHQAVSAHARAWEPVERRRKTEIEKPSWFEANVWKLLGAGALVFAVLVFWRANAAYRDRR